VVAGLGVERGFLTDSVKIDSTAFALEDARSRAAIWSRPRRSRSCSRTS